MRGRRLAVASIVVGAGIAAAAQLAAPMATPPLYDGVVVVEPYRYVDPAAGSPTGAKGASAHIPMDGHKSPFVAVATPEQPPQAQVLADVGTLVLPPTATSLDVSITPLAASADAAAASTADVLGNIYRFTIVDQAGVAATALKSGYVSVVLRAPENAPDAKVGHLVGGRWVPLKTELGFGTTFDAVVTTFGDFAVIVPGRTPLSPPAAASGQSTTSAAPSTSGAVDTTSGPSDQPPVGLVVGTVGVLAVVVLAAATLRGHRIRR